SLAEATRTVVAALDELRQESRRIADAALGVSAVTDEGRGQLARVPLDTLFHRGLAQARQGADRCGEILGRAVDQRRCSLDAVLALEYQEIKGADVASLARLFDVSRVPASGFTPPKFRTAYDALIDVEMQDACDAALVAETKLLF